MLGNCTIFHIYYTKTKENNKILFSILFFFIMVGMYDDDDLIPLDANNEFELFENNTEYQELCHGLLVQA